MEPDFGRYEVIEEIARGAYGVVYKARDRELDRTVALKTLRQGEVGPVARERFLREARLAASLDHPDIVRIFETGEHEGRPFYTMAFLEGAPLRGPLPPSEACRLMARVAGYHGSIDGYLMALAQRFGETARPEHLSEPT